MATHPYNPALPWMAPPCPAWRCHTPRRADDCAEAEARLAKVCQHNEKLTGALDLAQRTIDQLTSQNAALAAQLEAARQHAQPANV